MTPAGSTIENAEHNGRGGARIILCLALIGLGTAALAPSIATATPARFIHEVCDSALPGGGASGIKVNTNSSSGLAQFNSCATPGGAVGINGVGTASATFSLVSVGVPATPGGFVESLAISAQACGLGPANNNTYVWEREPQHWPPSSCSESQRIFHVRDAPGPIFSGANFFIVMNCDGAVGSCPPGPSIWARYLAATEVDLNPPTLSGLRGSLLSGGPIRGRQTIGADLADVGGGLSEAAVYVNRLPAGKAVTESCNVVSVKRPTVIGKVAVTPTPCPAADKVDWTLDTESYPFHDGANSVQICAFDFATLNEPNAACSPLRSVEVDNSCTPSTVDGGELLSAKFTASHDDTVTVAYGKAATISGRLATNAGDPVRGAALCVKMQTLGVDPRPATVGTVTTDANGNYRYEVKPGPNRQLVVGYRYDTHQVARGVSYYAHVRPTLKRNPPRLQNGKAVHLWGRLPGPRPGRRVVVLQANPPGSKRWITFKRATTDSKGAFRSSYRFSSTTRKTRYRFRAVVPRQAGYPWIEGHSKPASVTVTP